MLVLQARKSFQPRERKKQVKRNQCRPQQLSNLILPHYIRTKNGHDTELGSFMCAVRDTCYCKNLIITNLRLTCWGKDENATSLYWKLCRTHSVLRKNSSLARNKRFLTSVAYCRREAHRQLNLKLTSINLCVQEQKQTGRASSSFFFVFNYFVRTRTNANGTCLQAPFFKSSLLLSSSTRRRFYPQRSSGQAVVTGVVPSPPR